MDIHVSTVTGSNMFKRAISIYSSSMDYSKYSPGTRIAHVLTIILKPPNKLGVTPVSGVWAFAFALQVQRCSGGTSSQSARIRAASMIVLTSARG